MDPSDFVTLRESALLKLPTLCLEAIADVLPFKDFCNLRLTCTKLENEILRSFIKRLGVGVSDLTLATHKRVHQVFKTDIQVDGNRHKIWRKRKPRKVFTTALHTLGQERLFARSRVDAGSHLGTASFLIAKLSNLRSLQIQDLSTMPTGVDITHLTRALQASRAPVTKLHIGYCEIHSDLLCALLSTLKGHLSELVIWTTTCVDSEWETVIAALPDLNLTQLLLFWPFVGPAVPIAAGRGRRRLAHPEDTLFYEFLDDDAATSLILAEKHWRAEVDGRQERYFINYDVADMKGRTAVKAGLKILLDVFLEPSKRTSNEQVPQNNWMVKLFRTNKDLPKWNETSA